MKKGDSRQTPRRLPTTDEWERSWQKHWSKIGMPGYELPVGGPGGDEREFLATVSDLPENLTVEKLRLDYGGVGSQRYRQVADEIELHLDLCVALSRTESGND